MVERGQRLVDRHGALEAVDLVQVDGLDAEPAQARLAPLHDVLARDAAHVGSISHREMHLGGEDDLFHLRHLPQGASGDLLAHPHRVHVGGVEEVDAQIQGFLEERAGVDFVEYPGPPFGSAVGHAAQTDPGNLEAAAAQLRVFH